MTEQLISHIYVPTCIYAYLSCIYDYDCTMIMIILYDLENLSKAQYILHVTGLFMILL